MKNNKSEALWPEQRQRGVRNKIVNAKLIYEFSMVTHEDVSGCQVLASHTSGEAISCNRPVRVMRREPAYEVCVPRCPISALGLASLITGVGG